MPLGPKKFHLDVLGSPNFQIKYYNILGPCPWVLKPSICMFLDSKTSKLKILAP